MATTHCPGQQHRGGQHGDLQVPAAAFPLPSRWGGGGWRKPERKPQRCPSPGLSAPSVASSETRIQHKGARRDFCLLFPFSREKEENEPPGASSAPPSSPSSPQLFKARSTEHQNPPKPREERQRGRETTELQVLETAVSWECPGVSSKSRWAPLITQLTSTRSCLPYATLPRNVKKQTSKSGNSSKNASFANWQVIKVKAPEHDAQLHPCSCPFACCLWSGTETVCSLGPGVFILFLQPPVQRAARGALLGTARMGMIHNDTFYSSLESLESPTQMQLHRALAGFVKSGLGPVMSLRTEADTS